ncbi:Asp-tRNA(Asn)/Glu-tRNA(Gln) amidotransferase subunit GatA [bacterium NHP-B]|nr:Asp-tRNA(Asn)/Glu-tRNA(Gln) amidotransferase subunit GatA [bacterium NHP-B]
MESLTLCEARDALLEGTVSATELAQDILSRIDNSHLNAFISVDPDRALSAARESDARLARKEARPLEGLPIAVKDNICVRDLPMTAASRILAPFVPPYEATVTQKLWDQGAYPLGKTNLDEFAMGSTTTTSYFGACENPWRSLSAPDVPLVPGGSSGGSAAAVAGQLALAALGTDTAGSIRQPASFCGLVGLKPTYGRCSRWGVAPLASSLDQVGPMTQTVEDAALLMAFLAGHDAQDATSCDVPVPAYRDVLGQSIRGLRLGIPEEYCAPTMDEDAQVLWEKGRAWFEEAGAEIKPIQLPHARYALQTYTIICSAEASSNLARFDGIRYGLRAEEKDLHDLYTKTRDVGFGVEVKRRILIGTYAMSQDSYEDYFQRAQKVRRLIFEDFQKAFDEVDAVLTPTTPTGAFPIGQKLDDPTTMYLNDVFTVPQNMAGLPAISVPAMLNRDGLPMSLQLTGRPFEEETLLKLAGVLEKQVAFPRFGWKERV